MIGFEREKYGLIFDLDGTLWDSSCQVGVAWNTVFKRNGVELELTADRMAVMMGRTVPEIGEALIPFIEPVRRAEILDECCREENRLLNLYGGEVFPGVLELLPELHKKYRLFIVSNCQDGYIQSFINYYRLGSVIEDIECIGRTGLHKGDNIRLVFNRNGLEKALYLGDTKRDMGAAREAGLPFIRASYGFGGEFEAEYSISSFCELPQAAERILGR